MMNTQTEPHERDSFTTVERLLDMIFVVAMVALAAFLVYHQRANTGFFTAKFGGLEMLCLYGPIVLGILALLVRGVTGNRQTARPWEAIRSLLLGLGSLWLLIVFPFSFAHLADTLPESLRFLLSWVTDDIGKIPLLLQIILGPVAALTAMWKYFTVRSRTPLTA
ncbi:MAG: hypothetical protein R3E39_16935 [Anaerolineae bacterium]